MCGLAGVVIGSRKNGRDLDAIKKLFTECLLANEERGREATGAAILNDSAVYVEKAPVTASEFVKSRAYSDFLGLIGPDADIVLGHARKPTKGSPRDNNNNHPIIVGDIIGIHHGMITNDDEIFLEQSELEGRSERRIGSVDSEAIFNLIAGLDSSLSLGEYIWELRDAASRLAGSYTTLFVNRKRPKQLFLLKYDNPISLHYSHDLNALFFSTNYLFLRKTFGKEVVNETLPGKRGYVFHSNLLSDFKSNPMLQFGLKTIKSPHLKNKLQGKQ